MTVNLTSYIGQGWVDKNNSRGRSGENLSTKRSKGDFLSDCANRGGGWQRGLEPSLDDRPSLAPVKKFDRVRLMHLSIETPARPPHPGPMWGNVGDFYGI